MTGEVQPVCARCEHTPVEHSAGPCHQRSAAGVGCDCGGWAEIVTGGEDAPTQAAPSGDPIDTDEMIATWRPAPPPDDVLALCDEVDRLRAENEALYLVNGAADELIQAYKVMLDSCDEVDRLRAEVDALAAALADIAGMRPVIVAGRAAWISDAECSDLRGTPCHALDPDFPEDWCPICVAEVAWCAWKMGALA